jgi:TldD protein
LSRGGNYADLYFEHRVNHSIVFEEQIVKTATKSVNVGVGVRVLSGEKTGYAYSEDLSRPSILKAARTAAFIASAVEDGAKVQMPGPVAREHDLYTTPMLPNEQGISSKIALLEEANSAARAYDKRIQQV